MKVSELGEFGLIDLLNKTIAGSGINRLAPDLLIGIGDDTAAWKCSGKIQLATVDSMVEDVHFSPETASWREIGWKSLAISLSDIAAMGGVPRYALIALSLPEETDVENVTEMYQGMIDIARQYKTAIAGGNISRAPQVSITVTVLGESVNGEILKRSAAMPGDAIAVTGYPGAAAAGLQTLAKKHKIKSEATDFFRKAFLHPLPRITEGQVLVKNGVTTAIDISDGLLADLRHICEASSVSAIINTDRIPVHNMLKGSFREKAVELALSGGEDYELLFTGSARLVSKIKTILQYPVTVIGEIKGGDPGNISLIDAGGKPVKMESTGWTHF